MDFRTFIRQWRSWIRLAVFVSYAVAICVALPLCVWQLIANEAPSHVRAWFIGGIFVMMALPISLWGIVQHVIHYTTPHLQKYIIRILWMVPIYALNAWFALRFPSVAIYLDTLRECYEAYVIYNFMAYLLSFLNQEYPHLEIQIQNKPPIKWIAPLCCLKPIQNSEKFVNRCKHGVLQYTVVRPAMTILALICEMFDVYNEGDLDFKTGWSYAVIVNNVSQILAMYCLVLFYQGFKEELHYLKPVPKFLCVKAVVFMSFWQAVVIAVLAKLGVIPQNGPWIYYKDINEVSTGIQDFCICVEMFLAALAHYYSFSHKPFVNMAAEQRDCCTSFLMMWDVSDVREDVVEHARYIGRGMQKTISRGARLGNSRGSQGGGDSENTPLLTDVYPLAQPGDEEYDYFHNMQSQKSNTPFVHLDESDLEDSHSAGGDSSRTNHYGSFAAKSATSSMNNYAEFGASAEDGGSRQDSRHSGVDKSIEGAIIKGARHDTKASASDQSSAGQRHRPGSYRTMRPGDDEFEHLDGEEPGDDSRCERLEDGHNESVQKHFETREVIEGTERQNETSEDGRGSSRSDANMSETFVDVHNTDSNVEVV